MISKDQLEHLVSLGMSQRQMGEAIGVSQTTIRYHLNKHELSTKHDKKKSVIYRTDLGILKGLVRNSYCYADVLRKLGVHEAQGSRHRSLKARIQKEGIDVSHFDPWKKVREGSTRVFSDEELFTKDSPHCRSSVRGRIRRKNLMPYSCAICGVEKWRGKELSLHLDHINGINNDHRVTNLRFLCPNCHAQTPTHGSRNQLYK